MHRALIVSSKYDPATGYPDREAWRVSNKRLGLRLQQHGYAVEWLEPGAGLVRKLREALATEDPLSAVVMVFSGYVLLTESGDPAILLADEQVIALRLEQLCSKAGRTFGRVLVVLDGVRGSSTRVVQEANTPATETSSETLLARMAVRSVRSDNTGMLVRIAPWGAADRLPDAGLCEQLSQILENLDDSQALSTPELELDLLDSDSEDGAATLCRHSKPAFVFLPARRFASEPPKQAANAASANRTSDPHVDDSVRPHVSRDDEADDRDAWTPPPEVSTSHEDPPTLVPEDSSSEPPPVTAEVTRGPSVPPPLPPPAVLSAPLPLPPLHLVPAAPLPPLGAAAPLKVTPHGVPPNLPAPETAPPRLSGPPIAALAVPSLPPLAPLPLVFPASALPTSHPPAADREAHVEARTSRSKNLGTPPPLPSERGHAPSEAPGRSPSSESSGNLVAAPELGTPPPLPFERGISPEDGAPTPSHDASPPAVAGEGSQSPDGVIPRPSDGAELGVPPPLPSERASTELPPPPPLPLPGPPPTPLHTSVLAGEAGTTTSEEHNDASAASSVRESSTPASSSPATEDDAATKPVSESPRITADAPAPSDEADARVSSSPSQVSPPPRRRRDSEAPPAPPTPSLPPPAAPSLPPPVVSPESWRPQPGASAAPRDEAALLSSAENAWAARDHIAALSHAESCLVSFPDSARALQIAAGVLVDQGNFDGLAALYADLVSRQTSTAAAAQLCAAASRLWLTQLHHPDNAREWLERGLALDANNASLQREFADLLEQRGDGEQALTHSLSALRLNPMSPATAQATLQRLLQTDAKELTFSVACLLSFLGHTTNHVVDLIATQRVTSLPKPARSLSEEDYQFGLDVTLTDPELTRLFSVLAPYARQLELPKPKQQRQLLDSLRAEDVERSTTMLARTFGWTCRLLTVGSPALFLTETDTLPHLLPVDQMSFAVGKSLGRGLSLAELAFLWGRALGWSRPQTRILYSRPSTVKLNQFLRAARAAAGIEEATGAETKTLAKSLKKEVPTATWGMVTAALTGLESDPEERVESWKHAADRAANRIGLIACGDPELAARTLDRFPTSDGGSRKHQLAELLSFALSEEYLELRRRLGLHLG